ncbi:MAG: ABC transporter permease [Candidatus Aminicenantales bacterium]
MGVIVLFVMAAAGTLVFRVSWGPFGYFHVLGAVASFWTAAFFALLHALVRNRNQAGALSAPIILVFSLFGGSMMNPEAMPKAFKTVGVLTPNRWFIDGAALVRDGRFPLVPLLVLAFKKRSGASTKAAARVETRLYQTIARVISELVLYGEGDLPKFLDGHPEFRDIVRVESRFPENTVTIVPSGFDHSIPGTTI